MQLPEQLEELREKRVWTCYPLIWNEKKHNGVGGYDKPPVNPYTLYNGSTSDPAHLATFDQAAAQIGKYAHVRVKDVDGLVEAPVEGVGVALSDTGLFGIDFDNVIALEPVRRMKHEVNLIVAALASYTEISPSGQGLHTLCKGQLPPDVVKVIRGKPDIFGTEKAEYQLFDSGYMTITGNVIKDYPLAERTEEIKQVYDDFFVVVPPILTASTEKPTQPRRIAPSVVSCNPDYAAWLAEVQRMSDQEILDHIFATGRTGERVRALYNGDTSMNGGDHSAADLALCSYLLSFTDDQETTERLFRSSQLYRAKGKSRNYIGLTMAKAARQRLQLIGHRDFTPEQMHEYGKQKYTLEQRREYAKQRERAEIKASIEAWFEKRVKERP